MGISVSGVYCITNLKSNRKYIGSSFNVHTRLDSHFQALERGRHYISHLQNGYNKYGKENFTREILEYVPRIDGETNKEFELRLVNDREQYYLDTLLFASENDNRFYELGYNSRRKAASNLGTKRSESSKKNYSASMNRRWSDPNYGKSMRSKIITDEDRLKRSIKYGKPVVQHDLEGNFVAEYHAVAVAQRETGIIGIIHSCLGQYTKAGGFLFLYKEDFEKLTPEQFKDKLYLANTTYAGGSGAKKVNQLDKVTGEIINTFNSANEAGRSLGLKTGGNISGVCTGKFKTAYGYKWKYV